MILVQVAISLSIFACISANQGIRDPVASWLGGFQTIWAPDFSQLQTSETRLDNSDASEYSEAGFIVRSTFTDSACSVAEVSHGIPVNTCTVEDGYSYIVRLTQDSCVNAVVEYYKDKKCTQYAGKSAATVDTTCVKVSKHVYLGVTCTTRSEPLVFQQSLVTDHYKGYGCGQATSYTATIANTCFPAEGFADDDDYTIGDDDGDDDYSQDDLSYEAGGGDRRRALRKASAAARTGAVAAKGADAAPLAGDDDHDDLVDDGTDEDDMELYDFKTVCSAVGGAQALFYAAGSGCTGSTVGSVMLSNKCTKTSAAEAAVVSAADALDSQTEGLRGTDSFVPPAHFNVAAAALKRSAGKVKMHDLRNKAKKARAAQHKAAEGVHREGSAMAPTDFDDSIGDDVYDDHVYGYNADDGAADLVGVNPPPSVSTTPFPTLPVEGNPLTFSRSYCLSAPPKKTVRFTASQTINGASYAKYLSDQENYDTTIKQAVASVVSGATEDSVTDLVVTSSEASSRRRLALGTITASYSVTVENTILSAESLAGQLQSAVTNGAFDAALHRYAAENGADGFANAASEVAAAQATPTDDDDDKLHRGAIAGIVIGGFCFLVLLIAAALYWLWRPRAAAKAPPAPTQPETEMVAA